VKERSCCRDATCNAHLQAGRSRWMPILYCTALSKTFRRFKRSPKQLLKAISYTLPPHCMQLRAAVLANSPASNYAPCLHVYRCCIFCGLSPPLAAWKRSASPHPAGHEPAKWQFYFKASCECCGTCSSCTTTCWYIQHVFIASAGCCVRTSMCYEYSRYL